MRTDQLKTGALLVVLGFMGCTDDRLFGGRRPDGGSSGTIDGGQGGGGSVDGGTSDGGRLGCLEPTEELGLPDDMCAQVAADQLGIARHMTFSPSGDLYVAINNSRDGTIKGHITALRDADKDGRFERREEFHTEGGNGIAWHDGSLYFAENGRVLRFALPDQTLTPQEPPQVVVSGLPATGDHPYKSIVVERNNLWVNLGSATNSCQQMNRVTGSPGIDPCPELAERAGVWRFDVTKLNQTASSGERFVTGTRNATALALRPEDNVLYGIINGRDQLFDNWPQLYTEALDQVLPGEELYAFMQGSDYGWPYCYWDPHQQRKVLAPEYGGDGAKQGRCAMSPTPATWLPAHWAPLAMLFSSGTKLPERYRGGVFVTNHGSRFVPDATSPAGYNVVYITFVMGRPTRTFEIVADQLAGSGRPLPDAAKHRPLGLAQSPDGALYLGDDVGGRIWRITARSAVSPEGQQ